MCSQITSGERRFAERIRGCLLCSQITSGEFFRVFLMPKILKRLSKFDVICIVFYGFKGVKIVVDTKERKKYILIF